MSSLLAKDQGHTGPIVKCSSPCEHGIESGIKGCISEFFKTRRALQKEKVLPNGPTVHFKRVKTMHLVLCILPQLKKEKPSQCYVGTHTHKALFSVCFRGGPRLGAVFRDLRTVTLTISYE